MKEGKLIKELKELEHRIKEELDERRQLQENTELDLLNFIMKDTQKDKESYLIAF